MNNILWYQPAKLSDKDIVIKNGIILEEGTERFEAFQNLKKVSEKAIGKERPWHGKLVTIISSRAILKKKMSEADISVFYLSLMHQMVNKLFLIL